MKNRIVGGHVPSAKIVGERRCSIYIMQEIYKRVFDEQKVAVIDSH